MVKKGEVKATNIETVDCRDIKDDVKHVAKEVKHSESQHVGRIKIAKEHYYGTGKRKTSIAKVWLFQGHGNIIINDEPILEYIKRDVLKNYIISPLEKLNLMNKYDIVISTLGGGLSGQAGACRLGIARALLELNPDIKAELKKFGFLTRDSRIKERKKYGRKRARKGFQYRKR